MPVQAGAYLAVFPAIWKGPDCQPDFPWGILWYRVVRGGPTGDASHADTAYPMAGKRINFCTAMAFRQGMAF